MPTSSTRTSRRRWQNWSDAGIVLLNQAVLLAGVNDSVEAQAALCERLVDLRVMPYYLHQLDPRRRRGAFRSADRNGPADHRSIARATAGLRGAALRARSAGR